MAVRHASRSLTRRLFPGPLDAGREPWQGAPPMPHDGAAPRMIDELEMTASAYRADLAETSTVIELLEQALNEIADTTTDVQAKTIAGDALAFLHGR